jgi:hypothetical protein
MFHSCRLRRKTYEIHLLESEIRHWDLDGWYWSANVRLLPHIATFEGISCQVGKRVSPVGGRSAVFVRVMIRTLPLRPELLGPGRIWKHVGLDRRDYVSELRPPMSLLFIPQVIYQHGELSWDELDRGKLLIRLPELSGNPTSRVIW